MYIDTGYKPENHPEDAIVVPMGVPTPPVRRCRIFDGETMEHDYVRCLNPDGVEGFFDLVTQTFHPIEGG